MRMVGWLMVVGVLAGCPNFGKIGRNVGQGTITSEETREAVGKLADAAVASAMNSLTDDERQEKLRAAVDELVETAMNRAEDELAEDLGPEVRRQVKKAVAEALEEALSPAVEKKAGHLAYVVAERALDGVGDGTRENVDGALGNAITEAIKGKLGPALDDVLANNVRPHLQKVVDEDLPRGARLASEQAVEGAVTKLRPELARLDGRVGEILGEGKRSVSTWLYLALGAVGVIAFAIIVVQLRRGWVLSSAVQHVVAAIARAGAANVATEVRTISRGSSGGAWLSKFIDRHPDLNARPKELPPPPRVVAGA